MRTRSVLVKVPGYVFDIEALLPDAELAGLAGALYEAGHETRVWDYGTVEVVERLLGGAPRRLPEPLVDALVASPTRRSRFAGVGNWWRCGG